MNQFLSGFYFIGGMSSKGIVARISRIVESKNVKNVIKVLIPEMIVVPHSENKIKLNNTSVTNINVYIIVIVIINITVTMYIETRFDGKLITGHLFYFFLTENFPSNLYIKRTTRTASDRTLDENKLTHLFP